VRAARQYVLPDGRVTRPDQGNDTVSEGQAYGLLLAEAAGKPAVFGRIWRWTQVHLQLPSGLFAYHANSAGRVISTQPASDADLLIA
jgi:endoglucanase